MFYLSKPFQEYRTWLCVVLCSSSCNLNPVVRFVFLLYIFQKIARCVLQARLFEKTARSSTFLLPSTYRF